MPDHFLIIGGGAVGLTSANALLQAGYKVTLIERGAVGQEASWAGGGILSPLCSWDYQEPVTRLTQRSMSLFGDAMSALRDVTGINPQYRQSGMLLIPPFQNERATQWCAGHGVALQPVDLDEHLPGMEGAGLFMPDIAQVRNPRLLSALRRQMELLGGEILEHNEVQHIKIAGERVVGLQTSKGRLDADACIVAAGAWSKALLGEHALNMDVRPIRGQILLLKFDAPPIENILLQESLYLIPREDGHVLIGSTLEDVGFDKSTTEDARTSLLQRVYALFPSWRNQPVVQHWAGLRPGSPDNIPTIGRHPSLSNLYANCGHFRYGVTMSLACAELLLGEIESRPQPLPMDAYRWRE
jgi:glycine oxidase